MSEPCACLPGSESNGWHEVRCNECIANEIAAWGAMLADWRKVKADWARALGDFPC